MAKPIMKKLIMTKINAENNYDKIKHGEIRIG